MRAPMTSDERRERTELAHEAGHAVVASTLGRRRAQPLVENFVAGKIRERRRFLKMSQRELAAKMQVSPSLVSQWEQAKTRVLADDLERLAGALETSRTDLVGGPKVVDFYQVKEHYPITTVIPDATIVMNIFDKRDRQEQLMMDVFRMLNEDQRGLLIRLAQEIACDKT